MQFLLTLIEQHGLWLGLGTFKYSDYLPDSERAPQFDLGDRRVLMRKLLNKQLDVYEHQVANGTLSPSTLEGYSKAIRSERMKFWDDKAVAEVHAQHAARLDRRHGRHRQARATYSRHCAASSRTRSTTS